MVLELDDLLERRYNNITSLELDQVTLGVNMTIFLVNKYFLSGKKKRRWAHKVKQKQNKPLFKHEFVIIIIKIYFYWD